MTRIEANLESIKTLRSALLTYAGRQTDAMEAVESEIAYTLRMLAEAEHDLRGQIARQADSLLMSLPNMVQSPEEAYILFEVHHHLTNIADGAAYARGEEIMYWVEALMAYMPHGYALFEATQRLIEIQRRRQQVAEMVNWFRRITERYTDTLSSDLPHATTFLDDRITALEAYHATRLFATASKVAGTGILGVMGGVIGAISRSRGELSRVMGALGERVAAQVLSQQFGLQEIPFDQPKHGFDRLFRAPGMPLIVVESKVSSSGKLRLPQTKTGQQGSPQWVAAKGTQMTNRKSAQWSPANERIGQLVQELGAQNVPVIAVVINPTTNSADLYRRQGKGDWQLLRGGITL